MTRDKPDIVPPAILKEYYSTKPVFKKRYLCRAPLTSLRFDFNGNVFTCCYNKQFLLGTYPRQTIEQIWNGPKRKQLEKAILKNDLGLGCSICKDQLNNKEYYSVKSRLYDHLKKNKKYPVLLEFESDSTCNLECIMCNGQASSMIRIHREGKKPFQSIYHDNFLVQLEPLIPHISHANFIGGEPFLVPLYYKIWEKIITINNKIRINVSTNGTVLNKRIKEILEKAYFDISVSIDSVKKDSYESIRKNASYETVFNNLEYFISYCARKNTGLNIWVCPMTVNVYEIPEIISYFDRKNISVYFNTVIMPHNLSICYLKPEEIRSILNYFNNNKPALKNDNASRFSDLISQIKSWEYAAKNRKDSESRFAGMSAEGLSEIYINEAINYFNNRKNGETLKNNLMEKINTVMTGKDQKLSQKIYRFLLSIPVQESTRMITSGSTEFIEDYINQNF